MDQTLEMRPAAVDLQGRTVIPWDVPVHIRENSPEILVLGQFGPWFHPMACVDGPQDKKGANKERKPGQKSLNPYF
jgi:hypothetical protein